ncbi:cystatin-C-like [Hippopotamus amphibius kiboko]|uniref:cystatin-C-like n=1 Tax=Hippopotamus amphibius kiboko TaxID=575201 RepID=UPI00259A6D85|nr:cystatin-C-like [Hippopotamus amphibius kiboko]
MARSPHAPLLLLAALALALALAESPVPGQGPQVPVDADKKEKDLQRAVAFAISEYNKAINDEFYNRLLSVVTARKLVNPGVTYFLNVEIGRTSCTKSQPILDNCGVNYDPMLVWKQLCTFQVYIDSWTNSMSLEKYNCWNE